MKKYLLLFFVLFMCGCSPKYSLEIDGTKIKENINFVIDKKLIKNSTTEESVDIYSQESVNHILNNNLYPLINTRKRLYTKDIKESNDYYDVNLVYEYNKGELLNSRIINDCFENTLVEETKNGLKIKLSGAFHCYDSSADSFEFVVSTKNVVESASVSYNMFTNDYIWKIDKSNLDNVNIEMNILYESKVSHYGVKIAAIIIGILFLAASGFIIYKLVQRSKVNEI